MLVTSSTLNLDSSEELLRAARIVITVNYGRTSFTARAGEVPVRRAGALPLLG
ncbi:hypothetical protein GCM10010466_14810 [Planomonospora alba]|uniref:Uncharacterized protein n=1 Tax=Planomonospora alba TaxID=161354 RepID=A0ABP6MU04_9ACTN